MRTTVHTTQTSQLGTTAISTSCSSKHKLQSIYKPLSTDNYYSRSGRASSEYLTQQIKLSML